MRARLAAVALAYAYSVAGAAAAAAIVVDAAARLIPKGPKMHDVHAELERLRAENLRQNALITQTLEELDRLDEWGYLPPAGEPLSSVLRRALTVAPGEQATP